MESSAILILVWLILLRWARRSGWRAAMASLPGTIGHEALHAISGLLLGAKPTSFSVWPQREGNHWVLGSVSFRNLNILNSAPVALAPLWLIGIAWLLHHFWTTPALASQNYTSWGLSGYAIACCLFSCVPSQTDLKVGFGSFLLWSAIGYGVWLGIR